MPASGAWESSMPVHTVSQWAWVSLGDCEQVPVSTVNNCRLFLVLWSCGEDAAHLWLFSIAYIGPGASTEIGSRTVPTDPFRFKYKNLTDSLRQVVVEELGWLGFLPFWCSEMDVWDISATPEHSCEPCARAGCIHGCESHGAVKLKFGSPEGLGCRKCPV